MKKTNRSQSSFRVCKTLQSEEDENVSQSIASKKAMKPPLPKVGSSLIDHNKENYSMFQSVSERCLAATEDDNKLAEIDQEAIICRLQNQCRHYQQIIEGLKRAIQQGKQQGQKQQQQKQHVMQHRYGQYFSIDSDKRSQGTKNFNYSQRYYQRQIESLRKEISTKQQQIIRYQGMYSSKSSLAGNLSVEMSSKLEQEQKDKNLYIKQINSKIAEISKLEQTIAAIKSERDTLHILLQEKEAQIGELQSKVGQVDLRKKKIESYEQQIRESQLMLKEIEAQTQRMREEAEHKDQLINSKAKSILELEQTTCQYQQRIRQIEEVLQSFSREKKINLEQLQQAKRECDRWKYSYYELLKKQEEYDDLARKLKNQSSLIDDLKKRNGQLVSGNEKLKLGIMSLEKAITKSNELEKQLSLTRKEAKEREDKMVVLQAKERQLRQLQIQTAKLKKEKDEISMKLQDKGRQLKQLSHKLEQEQVQVQSLKQELKEVSQNSNRVKERNENIDAVVRENTKLSASLVDKINEVQKMQHKINNLDNKYINTLNQLNKNKVLLEQNVQAAAEMEIEIENLRSRYSSEMESRVAAEEKALRVSQQIICHKATIMKLEEQKKKLGEALEEQEKEHEASLQECSTMINKMESSRQITQEMLKEANRRIEELSSEISLLKRLIQEIMQAQEEHQKAILRLEAQIIEYQQKIVNLQRMNSELISKTQSIQEIANIMLRLQSNGH